MVGRHRQPPTVAQIAGRGATAPAAAWVADPDAPDGQPRRGGKRTALARYQIERLRLQPALDPATNRLGRPAEQERSEEDKSETPGTKAQIVCRLQVEKKKKKKKSTKREEKSENKEENNTEE